MIGRVRNKIVETLAATDRSVQRLGWASILGFLSSVFGYHSFATLAFDRLNRHWVLHGRDEPRWTRLDCLRLFQALDTLSVVGWPTGLSDDFEE
jgi:hypothetical protein